jgi:hypothetical protein
VMGTWLPNPNHTTWTGGVRHHAIQPEHRQQK